MIVRLGSVLLLGLLCGCPQPGVIGEDRPDQDGDGQSEQEGDCDDQNPLVGLGFEEICDGLDNSCDGWTDSGGICAREERFNQVPVLDLLFVVDNSCSMTAERERVSEGVLEMVPHVILPYHDVHVGVVTMDMGHVDHGGKLIEVDGRKWMDGTEAQEVAANWLGIAVDPSNGGQPLEQGRAAVSAALLEHLEGANSGFRRSDADLAVVMVSDEEDRSASPTLDEFVDWLADDPGLGRATVHAIVGTEEGNDCAGSVGASHLDLVDLTGGTSLSVCEADYGPFLAGLGQTVIDQALPVSFELREAARRDTLQVDVLHDNGFVDALEDAVDYTYDPSSHTVHILGLGPSAGTWVRIRYRVQFD